MKSLTVFEETVMIAVFHMKDDAYSVTIHRKILEISGKDVIVGTLFHALDQLTRKGYLEKKKGKPAQEKGGKSKMFYTVSEEGLKALEQTRSMHMRVWKDLPEILYKGN